MAQTCAICGAKINLVQQQKLIDGNFICRKTCQAKGMKKYFDYVHADLPRVIAHNEQVETGTKIFNQIFVPNMKKLKRFGASVFVDEASGLMALAEAKYKFFIFGKYYPKACVYRIADLYGYADETVTREVNGKKETKHCVHFVFRNVNGLSDFLYEGSAKDVAKYFNKLFGIQKTLGNVGNTWKSQINAVKAAAGAVKAAVNGEEDIQDKAEGFVDAMDTMTYGDRTELVRKADEALAPFMK